MCAGPEVVNLGKKSIRIFPTLHLIFRDRWARTWSNGGLCQARSLLATASEWLASDLAEVSGRQTSMSGGSMEGTGWSQRRRQWRQYDKPSSSGRQLAALGVNKVLRTGGGCWRLWTTLARHDGGHEMWDSWCFHSREKKTHTGGEREEFVN